MSAFVINPYSFAAAFVPTDISGLVGWWDASDSNTLYDATTGGSLVAADGTIRRWEDKTANAYHLTQSDTTKAPVRKTAIQNGRDVVRFDGSNDFIAIAGTLTQNQPSTIFIVCKTTRYNASSGSREYIVDGYLDGAQRNIVAARGNQTNQPSIFAGSWLSSNVSTPSGYFMAGGVFDGSSSKAISNNSSNTGNSGAQNRKGIALGVNYAGNGDFLNGDVCEMLLYNSALSSDNITKVYDYFVAKWAI